MNLTFKSLHPKFKLPAFATSDAAAFDLVALTDGFARSGAITKLPLGFAMAVPEGYAAFITTRSGHGAKFGAGVPHGYGLIDSDYRGELFMVLTTLIGLPWKAGDRIGQCAIMKVERPEFSLVADLPATARGEGGFGSTGA